MPRGPIYFVVSLLLIVASRLPAAEPLGLSATQPAEGPFVKTERGFMVPYTSTIPGTKVAFEMVPIPGGKFKMGSPETEQGRNKTEGPQFEVTVEPFWLGKYEVTWSEYRQFMSLYGIFKEFESKKLRLVNDANQADAVTAPTELYEPSFNFEFGQDPRQPAVTMTQYAARQYTKWMTGVTGDFYRLPGEAEWEYACRAGSQSAFHCGNDPAQLAEYGWFLDNAGERPHRVGERKPNAFGLYDMHGNVAEWVLDELLDDGYARFQGKSVTAAEAIVWPKKAYPRVVKGGMWDVEADQCRSAARLGSHDRKWKSEDPNLPLSPWWFTSDPSRGVGFRLLRPLREPAKAERPKFWDPDVDEVRFAVEDRLKEGRGALGLVDPELPAAMDLLKKRK